MAEELLDSVHVAVAKKHKLTAADQVTLDMARTHALLANVRAESTVTDRMTS
ncbi:MAG TPA: hypothetical protein VKG92_07850 [Flavobacteriales bacterium]|nr:hypothetical protein [Flavobacteriales bacterium]